MAGSAFTRLKREPACWLGSETADIDAYSSGGYIGPPHSTQKLFSAGPSSLALQRSQTSATTLLLRSSPRGVRLACHRRHDPSWPLVTVNASSFGPPDATVKARRLCLMAPPDEPDAKTKSHRPAARYRLGPFASVGIVLSTGAFAATASWLSSRDRAVRTETTIVGANFSDVEFRSAQLSSVTFSAVRLDRADFTAAGLQSGRFDTVRRTRQSSFGPACAGPCGTVQRLTPSTLPRARLSTRRRAYPKRSNGTTQRRTQHNQPAASFDR